MKCIKCYSKMSLEEFEDGYNSTWSLYFCENCEANCDVVEYSDGDVNYEWS